MALNVGLTGGVATGKSTVARLFQSYGASLIDADVIAKDVVQPGKVAYADIVTRFGKDILLSDQSLDRSVLRDIVFNDATAKTTLESIIHPAVHHEIIQQMQGLATEAYIIVDIPLLIEKHYQGYFDEILVVDCSYEQQLARILKRDGMSEDLATKIINAQISREERLKYASHVIHNAGSVEGLERQVMSLHNNFKDK